MIMILSGIAIVSITVAIYFAYRAYILAGLLADESEYIETLELTNQYMYNKICESYENMQRIDRLGAFETDDETGTTFELIKQTIDELKGEFDAEATKE